MELPVPRFTIDEYYIGDPPPVEVTVDNLNDNIDKQFLHNMVIKYGELEDLEIDYHPLTKKHLGLARLVFKMVRSARECVSALHGKSVMGKQLNCYLDPRGVMAAKMFQDLTTDRKPSPPPPPPPEPEPPQEEEEPPPPEDNYRQDESWEGGGRWDWEETRDSWGRERDYEYGREGRHDKREKRGRDRWKRRDDMYDHHSSRDADNSHSHDAGHYNDYYNNVGNDWKGRDHDQGEGYWSQQASSYSGAPGGGYGEKEEGGEKKESGSESERHVDLDTRLKMLMKDKSGGMPAFLLGATTSDEDEKPIAPPPPPIPVPTQHKPDDPILDRTPSPFRDRNAYIKSYWITRRQDEMAQVNCALASYNHLTMDPHKRPFSRASDRMSLSSLSPGENKIHQEEPNYIPPPNNQYGFAPGYGFNPFPGQPYGSVPWYGDRSQQDPYSLQYGVPGPGPGSGQFDQYNDHYQWNNQWNQAGEEVKESKQKKNKFQGKDRRSGLIDSVVSIVEAELKKTLKKDINKKMCETLAFMLFDSWWNEQEIKYKEKVSKETKKTSAPTIGILPDREKVEALPRIPKPEDLSSLIDKQRESMAGSASTFGLGGSLGLGRLGAIPKLKKTAQPIRPPSPKWENRKKHKHREKSRDEKEEEEDGEKFKLEREKERQARKEKKKERKEKESPKKSKDSESKDKTTVESLYSAIYGDSDSEEDKKPKEEESSEVSESEPEIKTTKDKSKSSPETSDTSNAGTSSVASSASSSSSSASSDSSDDDDDDKKAKKRSSSSDSSSSSSSSKSKSASLSKSRSRSKSRTPVRLKSRSPSGSSEVRISPPSTPTTTPKEKSPVKKEKSVSPARPKKVSPEKNKSKAVVEGSSTETDNENDESKVEESTAAQALMSLASSKLAEVSSPVVIPPSPVKVQYLEDAASPPHIMDHCYAKPVARRERKETQSSVSEQEQQRSYADHDYARPSSPSPAITEPVPPTPPAKVLAAAKRGRKPGHGYTRPQLPVQPVKFKPREMRDQYGILYKFLTEGIDNEDIAFLKRSYDMMLLDNQPNLQWINDTHWVDHPSTGIADPPKKKRRLDDFSKVHKTGSARTEGYYKMDPREKARTKYHFHRTGVDAFSTERKDMDKQGKQQKAISASREARSQQRRMLTALGDDAIESDLLKFNQLKFRRKAMKFGKSAIHDWGLFALEAIGADEMVIEYVGAVVRPLLSDMREKRYEKQGIGSSYLFRIDLEYVVDATKCGNLARFVNHSCDPNCYAKIIKIDGQSKIVIYSKVPIALGEEITYDYKFPIEDEKIRCLCASKNCRKYLN